jgi:hypothetical protein
MSDLKMTVRDQEFPVTVRVTHNGKGAYFELDPGDGRTISSVTWDGLYTQAMTVTRRPSVKVSVPVMEYQARTGRFRKGTATSIHQGSGKVLVTWQSPSGRDSNEQVAGYEGYFEPMPEAEQAEYHRLWQARKAAADAVRAFEDTHKLALRSVVSAAVEAELKRQVRAEL